MSEGLHESEDFTGTADVPSAFDLSGNTAADKMSAVPVKSCSLPISLQTLLISEAHAAFPRECCGLIEGVRRGEIIEVVKLHPTRNLSAAPDRFEIDPAEQIRLLRTLRGTGREIVGCYHSHPDGEPAPSQRDVETARDENFVWLIAGVNRAGTAPIGAYLFAANAFRPLKISVVATLA